MATTPPRQTTETPTTEQADAPVAGSSVMPRLPIAAASRPRRFLIVTVVVAVYIGLGFLLRLNLAEYQLLGIPLVLVFQWGIQRQPLRALWVRSAPPLRLDTRFFLLWVLFSLVPAYEVLTAVTRLNLANAALYGAGIAGAFGLAYALRAMRAINVRQLGLCLLTAGVVGILPQLLAVLLPSVLHLHIGAGQPNALGKPALWPNLQTGAETLLWGLSAGFIIEEVFFRGALDTYLHRGERGTGWLSAIFISALWGVWHLPGQTIRPGHLLSTIVGLLVAQILVGVPLSYWWRKSGNLTVNNTTHAVLDAVRTTLAALV